MAPSVCMGTHQGELRLPIFSEPEPRAIRSCQRPYVFIHGPTANCIVKRPENARCVRRSRDPLVKNTISHLMENTSNVYRNYNIKKGFCSNQDSKLLWHRTVPVNIMCHSRNVFNQPRNAYSSIPFIKQSTTKVEAFRKNGLLKNVNTKKTRTRPAVSSTTSVFTPFKIISGQNMQPRSEVSPLAKSHHRKLLSYSHVNLLRSNTNTQNVHRKANNISQTVHCGSKCNSQLMLSKPHLMRQGAYLYTCQATKLFHCKSHCNTQIVSLHPIFNPQRAHLNICGTPRIVACRNPVEKQEISTDMQQDARAEILCNKKGLHVKREKNLLRNLQNENIKIQKSHSFSVFSNQQRCHVLECSDLLSIHLENEVYIRRKRTLKKSKSFCMASNFSFGNADELDQIQKTGQVLIDDKSVMKQIQQQDFVLETNLQNISTNHNPIMEDVATRECMGKSTQCRSNHVLLAPKADSDLPENINFDCIETEIEQVDTKAVSSTTSGVNRRKMYTTEIKSGSESGIYVANCKPSSKTKKAYATTKLSDKTLFQKNKNQDMCKWSKSNTVPDEQRVSISQFSDSPLLPLHLMKGTPLHPYTSPTELSAPAPAMSRVKQQWDRIDELIKEFHNTHNSTLKWRKIKSGIYCFGTNKVIVKLCDGQLYVQSANSMGFNFGRVGDFKKFVEYCERLERQSYNRKMMTA